MAKTQNGEPSRASGSGPSKSTTSAEDMYHANEPLLRPVAMGLLVEISDALGDVFAGRTVDARAGTVRACELQAMIDHPGRVVAETIRPQRRKEP